MGRHRSKLTDRTIKSLTDPGEYPDGNRLYLQISRSGTKSWVLRYQLDGKRREMGLGSVTVVSLAEARQEANRIAKLLHEKCDPINERNAALAAKRITAGRSKTFDECAKAYIDAHRSSWKNHKHVAQWESTLSTYANPVIGSLSVADIETNHVLRILEPIWNSKNETASRLRGRLESILDWSTVREFRQGQNPARWKGHLDTLLPAPTKVQKPRHHAALPYSQMHTFMQKLRERDGAARLAFEFCILTATRTCETIMAQWDEIDEAARLWTIPKERMKVNKEHVIPLSDKCMELLVEARALGNGKGFIFPGRIKGKPLSNMTFLMLLRRMKREDLTGHGFRSTFRDWAGETTAYPREVIEHAMSHQLKDKAEAAYARGTLLEKRKSLMNDWANYCDKSD